MTAAYYNEIDPFAAQWLRELIKARHIAPGEVDERSIEDVIPSELMGYDQCHFFAGIGVWSHALRNAGWPDGRPIWTGSCPCQPFSAAGKGGGTSDERHLWPAFEWLIRQCRPDCVIGEQVESAIKHDWLDYVALSLEGIGYAVGAVGFPACSTGAPHIRQRLYWVADSNKIREERSNRVLGSADGREKETGNKLTQAISDRCPARRVADAVLKRGQQERGGPPCDEETHGRERWDQFEQNGDNISSGDGEVNAGVLGDSEERGLGMCGGAPGDSGRTSQPGPTNGFWVNAEWLPCRDGKARPVEPGTFPLAHGTPARVGRLRGYGNAIVAPQAEAFVTAFMEISTGEGIQK